eukprot:2999959-Alexandrium_andersonii.AAC.1
MEAAFAEISLWQPLPAILLGDLNADPSKVCPLLHALTEQTWFDLGSMASAWGGIDFETTARAH